jgi:hypothetical protein
VSLYVVDPAPTTTISVKGPEELAARSILNPASLVGASFQEMEMLLADVAVAVKPDGGSIVVTLWVVAFAVLE